MSGHVSTLGGTPAMRGPPQVSRLPSCDSHTGTFLKLQEQKAILHQNAEEGEWVNQHFPKDPEASNRLLLRGGARGLRFTHSYLHEWGV